MRIGFFISSWSGSIAAFNHRLVPAGKPPASSKRPLGRGKETPGKAPPRTPYESPESGCGFVSQDAGGELVRTQDCPELSGGGTGGRGSGVKAHRSAGPSGTRPRTLSAWTEDAGTPAGVLAAKERVSGGIASLNHRLVPSVSLEMGLAGEPPWGEARPPTPSLTRQER